MNLSKALFFVLAFFVSNAAEASGFTYHYTTLDLTKCMGYEEGEGGASATCRGEVGPMGQIDVEMIVGDWTNVSFLHAGKRHLAWQYIVDVGSFTRVGGANRLMEWVKGRDGIARAVIFRVEADRGGQEVSKLVVFGITKYEMCYFGTVQTNQEARTLGETAYCGDYLPSEAY